ncbi:hypothetical protein LSM04_008348 [Trypanosoma melophagium]|uniref:uncharacterized protein n=1 Tax=Trypanosoma melophagium TaxID=715481 RepID=UPI00351A61B4|nr:hypothetical protein LSM04_008348 [Trypanosoma melophagium]
MGVSSSKKYPHSGDPVVLPSVSRMTDITSDAHCSGLSGMRSLNGVGPAYGFLYEWQAGLPDIRFVGEVPENDIVSDGETEGVAWDRSVGSYDYWANDEGESIHYVSAMGLKTPSHSIVLRKEKDWNRNGCFC